MQPDHDRTFVPIQSRSPDVKKEAVFICFLNAGGRFSRSRALHRAVAVFIGVHRFAPGFGRSGRFESEIADRGGSVTDTLENMDSVLIEAADGTVGRFYDVGRGFRYGRGGFGFASRYREYGRKEDR